MRECGGVKTAGPFHQFSTSFQQVFVRSDRIRLWAPLLTQLLENW